MRFTKHVTCLLVLLLLVTGCATMDQRAGFAEMSTTVKERSGMQVVWNAGTESDAQVAAHIQSLLADKLTADEAVQVALLNNRNLQATYAALGVAQSDLVQAGLLKNPVFDIGLLFPLSGGQTKLDLFTALDFLDIFYIPLKKRVASALFEDTKFQVTGTVLEFAATVRAAFYRHQANEQLLVLQRTINKGLAITLDVAQRLHEAGNITDLDLGREQALFEDAKLQLAAAEMAVRRSQTQLHTFMGLWGPEPTWTVDPRLADIPEQPTPLDGVERQAIRHSLDLASAQKRIIVAGEQVGFNKSTALLPELSLGALAEREDSEWKVGPVFGFSLPIFDQGQGRIGRAMAELRRMQQTYYAMAVQIRSATIMARDRVQATQARALYYRDVLLPLQERIVSETQLQYNAMQLGIFALVRSRERQIQGAVSYIGALLDYWLARTELGLLLSGRLPNPAGFAMARQDGANARADNAGH